jgi:copper chaperone
VSTSTYTVSGMTCEHCVASVTEELSDLDGVRGVEVDLGSGAVTVTSDAQLDAGAVREAVEEAGYQLAERSLRSEHQPERSLRSENQLG